MDDLLLSIDKISVKYGSIEALHEVSMHVKKGDIVSLIGANGAGKSTLLKAIMAQVPLSNGSISFEGEEICSVKKHGKTTHQLAAIGMALVPEGRHVFADMTVEEDCKKEGGDVRFLPNPFSKKEAEDPFSLWWRAADDGHRKGINVVSKTTLAG